MIEIWKDIKGYEGLYQVSDLGRVKSLARQVKYGRWHNNKTRVKSERILTPILSRGYCRVNLYDINLKQRLNSIHGLVAASFIDNPENKPCINHKDGNKQNNCIDNLEWCTYSENNLHSYSELNRTPVWLNRSGKLHPASKPVICLTTNKRFESARLAADFYGLARNGVSEVCKGKFKQVKGYKFKYAM